MNELKKEFLLGAATAAHQVEGNNIHSDFWTMETLPGTTYAEPSLDAVDHYHKYEEDITLLAETGCNAYRFSIEWARIEPEKGKFDEREIAHYRSVLQYCHQLNVTPIVTLHHFSSPKWLISAGGWESEDTIGYFEQYTRYVISELGDLIPYVCTINEANMGGQIAKIMESIKASKEEEGEQEKSSPDVQVGLNTDAQQAQMETYFRALGEAFQLNPRKIHPFLAPQTKKGEEIVMHCHQASRKAIKELNPDIQVGVTLSIYDHQAVPGGEHRMEQEQYDDFIQYLPYLEKDDFLGVQNYSRKIHGPNGVLRETEITRLTKMGYEFYPEALGNVLRFVTKFWNKPLLVTENGLSTEHDPERIEFIERAVEGVKQAKAEGVPVIGYLYWSLLDNFEWQLGYTQIFGLIAVDRLTQIRQPKKSLTF